MLPNRVGRCLRSLPGYPTLRVEQNGSNRPRQGFTTPASAAAADWIDARAGMHVEEVVPIKSTINGFPCL